MAARACPKCGHASDISVRKCRISDCDYEFSGDEIGANPDGESEVVEVASRTLDDEELQKRIELYSADTAESEREKSERYKEFLKKFGVAALVVAVGVLFIGISLLLGKQGVRGFFLGIPAALGFLAIVGALVAVMKDLVSLVRPLDLSTPEKVARLFYQSVLDRDGFSWSKAWICLDQVAKAEFIDIDHFKRHWKQELGKLKKWGKKAARRYSEKRNQKPHDLSANIAMDALEIEDLSEFTARSVCSIVVRAFDWAAVSVDIAGNIHSDSVGYLRLACPQTRILIKGSGRCFLTSGKFDRPKTME